MSYIEWDDNHPPLCPQCRTRMIAFHYWNKKPFGQAVSPKTNERTIWIECPDCNGPHEREATPKKRGWDVHHCRKPRGYDPFASPDDCFRDGPPPERDPHDDDDLAAAVFLFMEVS